MVRQIGRLDCSLPSRMHYTSHYGVAQNSPSSVHMSNGLLHALEGWDTQRDWTRGDCWSSRLPVRMLNHWQYRQLSMFHPHVVLLHPPAAVLSHVELCWCPQPQNAKRREANGRSSWLLTRWVALGTDIWWIKVLPAEMWGRWLI